jgi:hypothetical protein
MPTVDDAIRRVTYNIKNAGAFGVSAIKLIHGYGSTGKGGVIRTETRAYLERQKKRGIIKYFITGEEFSIFNEDTRKSFLLCDELRRDSDIERHNNGITIVILSTKPGSWRKISLLSFSGAASILNEANHTTHRSA